MSKHSDDLEEIKQRKPHVAARMLEAKLKFNKSRKLKQTITNLTGGGFLVPKLEVFKEGLEELRDVGHAKADVIAKIRRKMR